MPPVTPQFVRLASTLALTAMGPLMGCAWLLGQGELPQPPAPFPVANASATATVGTLSLDVRLEGVGQRLVTSTNAFGRVGRAVNPYGEDTLVFQVSAHNLGKETLVLKPQDATLLIDEGTPRHARSLDEYRRRWPSWPVSTDDERQDQAAAYAHVLGTLLLERAVAPGQVAEGRLAFALLKPRRSLTLTLPFQEGRQRRAATLGWRLP